MKPSKIVESQIRFVKHLALTDTVRALAQADIYLGEWSAKYLRIADESVAGKGRRISSGLRASHAARDIRAMRDCRACVVIGHDMAIATDA